MIPKMINNLHILLVSYCNCFKIHYVYFFLDNTLASTLSLCTKFKIANFTHFYVHCLCVLHRKLSLYTFMCTTLQTFPFYT